MLYPSVSAGHELMGLVMTAVIGYLTSAETEKGCMMIDKTALIAAGIDPDDALKRLMNSETLYLRLIKKLLDDKTFSELKKAVEERDHELMFRASHTLKGVAGNLSLKTLYGLLISQVEFFRAGNDDEGIAMMDDVERAYNAVIEAISNI